VLARIGERDRRERDRNSGTKQHLFQLVQWACQTSAPRRVLQATSGCTGRSSLDAGGSAGPRSGLSGTVQDFWRVLRQPGGTLQETGLASSLAGAMPGGAFTRWWESEAV
jgi:hypothetical protein